MENKKYISTKFSNYEKVNDEFVRCTVSVNSYDQIANGTKFRKTAIEKALPTLNYAPVIGYFKDGDFTDHGVEYVIDNEGISEVIKTIPFGVVIKDSQRWEKLQKPNGEMEEYVLVDCYLWGRYKEAVNKVMENKCNQSMEVLVNSGEYNFDEDYYDITDFSYSAICILGESTAPAFDLAKIRTSDKFSKDDFKACYSKMTEALDKFLNFEEGGIEVEDNKELEIVETTEVSETEEVKAEVVEESVVEEVTENDEVEEAKEEEVKEDSEVEVETEPETVIEETEDFEHKYNEVVKELNELKAKYTDLKSDYDILQEENKELANFKLNIEKEQKDIELNSVFEKYSALNKVEGYSSLFEKRYELDEEELIKSLKVLAFDNNININVKNKKDFSKNSIKIPVVSVEKDINRNTAWDILEKHIK